LFGEPVLLGGLNQRQAARGCVTYAVRGGVGASSRGDHKQQNPRYSSHGSDSALKGPAICSGVRPRGPPRYKVAWLAAVRLTIYVSTFGLGLSVRAFPTDRRIGGV
jgi:hypothetical protein